MGSPVAKVPIRTTGAEQRGTSVDHDDRAAFVETPERRRRSARGVLIGLLLGAGLWMALLALLRIIKL